MNASPDGEDLEEKKLLGSGGYVGVKLGVFDCLASDPRDTSDIAKQLSLVIEWVRNK